MGARIILDPVFSAVEQVIKRELHKGVVLSIDREIGNVLLISVSFEMTPELQDDIQSAIAAADTQQRQLTP